jgi:charged multivesicular body protein 1
MDNFEKQFDELDIQSAVMEKSVRSATSMSTPEDEVESLMQQVADEHGLELKGNVDSIQVHFLLVVIS